MLFVLICLVVWQFVVNAKKPSTVVSQPPSGPQALTVEAKLTGKVSMETTVPPWLRQLIGDRSIAADNLPPAGNVVIENGCPGEGCGYQMWLSTKDLPLFDAWNSQTPAQVHTVSARETVTALRGVFVTLSPGVEEALLPLNLAGTVVQPGELLYSLLYLGEGWERVFVRGRVIDCNLNGQTRLTKKLRDSEWRWWAEIRTNDGVVGWTNETPSFLGVSKSAGPFPYVKPTAGQQHDGSRQFDFEVYIPADAGQVWIRVGDSTLPCEPKEGTQHVQSGPLLQDPGRYMVELVSAQNGTLAKTFIRVESEPKEQNAQTVGSEPPPIETITPTFDCAKAATAAERLICQDRDLAGAERAMVTAHDALVARLSTDQLQAFRREHLEWFKTFSRTCNAMARSGASTSELKECIKRFLSEHTAELRSR